MVPYTREVCSGFEQKKHMTRYVAYLFKML